MKVRWPKLILAATGITVLIAVVAVHLQHGEPVYDGRPLSYWEEQLWGPDAGAAQTALSEIGAEAVPFVLNQVRREHSVARNAYRAIWPALPPVLRRTFGQPAPRTFARSQTPVYALMLAGEPAVPQIIAALSDRDASVRAVAADALGKIGTAADQAVPSLIPLLGDAKAQVRQAAAGALGNMGPGCTQAIPALIASLTLTNPPPINPRFAGEAIIVVHARETAAEVLGKLGPQAQGALPQLSAMLTDSDPFARVQAAIAIWRINRDTNAVRQLVSDLGMTAEPNTLGKIFRALAEMGPAAESAAVVIKEKLQAATGAMADSSLRAEAAIALWKTSRDTNAVALLAAELEKSPKPYTSHITLAALGEMGPEARAAVPVIQSIVNGPGGWGNRGDLFLEKVRAALRKIDPDAAAQLDQIAVP